MRGVGIDIVEIDRVRKANTDALAGKILSAPEHERYEGFSPERKISFLAGRFAAKEAIIKCLSAYELPEFADLIITNDEKGRPQIRYKDYEILLSISHEKNYATAIAILE